MAAFDPDAPSKRAVLAALISKHERVRRAFADLNLAKGTICWDASGTERSLLKAIQYGLAMVRTDCSDEWVVAGSGVFAILRTLEEFKELGAPEIACGLTYAGDISRMRIYLLPWPDLPPTEFIVGHYDAFTHGMCTEFPIGFAENAPPQMAEDAEDDDEDYVEDEINCVPNPPNDAADTVDERIFKAEPYASGLQGYQHTFGWKDFAENLPPAREPRLPEPDPRLPAVYREDDDDGVPF